MAPVDRQSTDKAVIPYAVVLQTNFGQAKPTTVDGRPGRWIGILMSIEFEAAGCRSATVNACCRKQRVRNEGLL